MPTATVRANENLRSIAAKLDLVEEQLFEARQAVQALQDRERLIARECVTVREMLALAAKPPKQ